MMNIKKYRIPVIVLILASALLSSLLIGIGLGFKSGISTGNADYVVLEGVAGNDYYDSRQYSYDVNTWATSNIAGYPVTNPGNLWFNANKSLRVGMTEYGEFATPQYAGIAYGYNSAEWNLTESWASTMVNPAYWIQGWVFYMNYTRIGPNKRCIEGYALYSDPTTSPAAAEGARKVYSWDGNYDPSSSGPGIVTLGSLTTSGVQILYDSARLVVGRTSVVIRDGNFSEDVAKVTFTVIFNKDAKYAIIYKDVKILLDQKILMQINDFAFSERYEIDLARGDVNPTNGAYIHYFANNITSVYQHPLTGSNKADVLQAFNPNRNYTFFAGYWPNATEYSVYAPLVPNLPNGYTRLLDSATAVADIPSPPTTAGEPYTTPLVTVQWRYNSTFWTNMLGFLARDANREIRFVEVAGMTDYNMGNSSYALFKALDLNVIPTPDPANNIDTEIRYLLNNVFNPEDLKSIIGANYNMNPLWNGIGQSSAASDSAGASMVGGLWSSPWYDEPLALLDKNDTGLKGTIPYGLSPFTGTYSETFSNSGKATGTDTTSYVRTGLNGFAFNYDNYTSFAPQPVAGGYSAGTTALRYWYPSKDPLTQRWVGTWTASQYDAVTWHPNGIISVGGPKANWLSRYFNDFNFAIDREGTSPGYALVNGGTVTGSAPTSNPSIGTLDFFPLSTWKTSTGVSYSNIDNTAGYAVIAVARDVNGTRGISVYGWDARDTYWASAWTTQYLGNANNAWIPSGTVAIILKISYISGNTEPSGFTVVKALGTITEFGTNRFTTAYGYDAVTGPTTWSAINNVANPPIGILPTYPPTGYYWWFAKLPTTSTALVDFDP